MKQQLVRTNLEHMVSAVRSCSSLRSVAVIGSYATAATPDPHDVDLLILVDSLSSGHTVLDCLRECPGGRTLTAIDDIFSMSVGDVEFSIALRAAGPFLAEMRSLCDGSADLHADDRPWVLGGRIPEVLLFDLCRCLLMHDAPGDLTALCEQLRAGYPPGLARAISMYLVQTLPPTLTLVHRSIRCSDWLGADMGLGQVGIGLIRYVFATHGLYMPALKHVPTYVPALAAESARTLLSRILLVTACENRTDRLQGTERLWQEVSSGTRSSTGAGRS